jgi:Circadian oscillating protein COP23
MSSYLGTHNLNPEEFFNGTMETQPTLPPIARSHRLATVFKKMSLAASAVLLASSSILPAIALPISQSPSGRNEPSASPSTRTPSTRTPSTRTPSTRTPSNSTPVPQQAVNARFSCQNQGGEYTVVYNPQSQPGKTYPWAKPTTMGGGWTPELRCAEISRRLEEYRPGGLLEMQTAVENGYNTICVTTSQVPACRIVLTVPEGEDPLIIRDRVFGNLTVADNGQQTTAVTTFSGDDNNIINQVGAAVGVDLSSLSRSNRSSRSSDSVDLRPFLDPADGGTGARLR